MNANSAAPSAQVDRFVHDRLPPPAQWPTLRYDRPELRFAYSRHGLVTFEQNVFRFDVAVDHPVRVGVT